MFKKQPRADKETVVIVPIPFGDYLKLEKTAWKRKTSVDELASLLVRKYLRGKLIRVEAK